MNLLLAQVKPADRLQLPTTKTSPELFWFLIAVGAIVVVVIVWAIFFRRRPEEFTGWGPSHSHYRPPKPEADKSSGSHRRRRRRRRREHRPRNPTLAETGGLPPVRTDHSSTSEP